MGKFGKWKKRFTRFVNELTEEEVREQLVLAYLQMEKCQQVLRGEDAEPVEMLDNGRHSDLELFYMCKKAQNELSDGFSIDEDGEIPLDSLNLRLNKWIFVFETC